MSDPINLRLSGVNPNPGHAATEQPEKPLTRFQVLALGGDDGVGILGQVEGGKVPAHEGDGAHAPDGRRGTKTLDKIKNAFAKIANAFRSLGDDIRASRQARAEKSAARTELGAILKEGGIGKTQRTEALVIATRTGNPGDVAKVLQNIAQSLGKEYAAGEGGRFSPAQMREALYNLQGSVKHPTDERTFATIRDQADAIRTALGDNPAANQLLDLLTGIDFKAEVNRSFDQSVAFLTLPPPVTESERSAFKNNLTGLFRSNNLFSNANVGMNRADGHFRDVAQVLRDDISDIARAVRQHDKDNKTGNYTANTMPVEHQARLKEAALLLFDAMRETQGSSGVLTLLGTEGVNRLNEFAQRIMDNPGISVEHKNEAILKLVIDQVFLRGHVAAFTELVSAGKDNSFERVVAQVVQKAISDGSANFSDPGMMSLYNDLREVARGIAKDMVGQIGLPVARHPPVVQDPMIGGDEGIESEDTEVDDFDLMRDIASEIDSDKKTN